MNMQNIINDLIENLKGMKKIKSYTQEQLEDYVLNECDLSLFTNEESGIIAYNVASQLKNN